MSTTLIYAHRGANREAGENTRTAFARALAYPIDGIETDVQLSSDGVPVLFVHGFPLDRTIWWEVMPALTGRRRIAPDLRGMGLSEVPQQYAMAEYADDRAARLNDSAFMKAIKADIDKAGVMVLSDAWLAGAFASKRGCIRAPADVKGLKFRSAGPTFAAMWQAAGASIVSPPSNEIYNAFQTGVVNGTDTSLGTFASMRLYEVTKCLTAPGDNALWFMYEPVLMSKKNFAKLDKKQQAAIIKAGKDAQKYYESKAKAVDDKAIKVYRDHKVEVVSLTDAEYAKWIEVAKKSSYAEFAKEVPDGQKLIDEALAVK